MVSNVSKVIATFPTNYTNGFFEKIKELSNSRNKAIWEKTEKKAKEIEKTIVQNIKITVLKENKPLSKATVSFTTDSTYSTVTNDLGQAFFKVRNIKVGYLYTIYVNGQSFTEPLNPDMQLKFK